MTTRIAEILFTVFFGLCFGWMGNQMLKDIFPIGIGSLIRDGFWSFIPRLLIVSLTFILSSISFVFVIRFCSTLKSIHIFHDVLIVLALLVAAICPWAMYHLARIICRPIAYNLYVWEGWLRNVDVVFLAFYVPTVICLFYLVDPEKSAHAASSA